MPRDPVPLRLRSNAKRMRKAMTEAERRLWSQLRAHRLMGLGFRRQLPIGKYIVDFACHEYHLLVEINGSQHARAKQVEHDVTRTEYIQETGWRVLRFWNDDVLKDLDNVCQHIVIEAGLASSGCESKGQVRR